MSFPSRTVGFELEPNAVTLSTRAVLAYAAGLGLNDAVFLDDAQAGGLKALPFQCVSFEWPVTLSLRRALIDELTPQEARRGVHAVQDSIFHRVLAPGDAVVTSGRLASVRQIRSGALIVCAFETRGAKDGALITTTWSSSVYRDVKVEGGDQAIAAPPEPPAFADAALEGEAEAAIIPIPRSMPHLYSECASIWNPIHTERAAALAAGLPDIILHGTATWALAGARILMRYADGDVRRIRRHSGRFTGMIIPGGDVVLRSLRREGGVVWDVVDAQTGRGVCNGFAVL